MRKVPRDTALKVIYWNVVGAILVVCLAFIALLHRVHRYDEVVVRVSRSRGLSPRLVSAVVWQESRFRADRVGKAGEIGLMQVMPATAGEWARAQRLSLAPQALYNPETNLLAGTWYLARAIRHWSRYYDDPLPAALAEYNAGRGAVQRWAAGAATSRELWQRISYPTTKRYVADILRRYRGKV